MTFAELYLRSKFMLLLQDAILADMSLVLDELAVNTELLVFVITEEGSIDSVFAFV